MTLALPWLLALLPLPWLLRRWLAPRSLSARVPVLPLAHWYANLHGTSITANQSPLWRRLLWWLLWLLVVLALARPQVISEQVIPPDTGRDLMLVVDLSPSMEIEDMVIDRQAVSRFDAVKQVGRDFIARREGDRIGLIVFSTTAHVYSPMTFDQQTVARFLDESFIGMAGGSTAIGDALGLAVKHMREHSEGDRAIILLTDGKNNAGELDPTMAGDIAAAEGIRVYTIGVGSPDDGRARGFMGQRNLQQPEGVDTEQLEQIASRSGGEFFMARDSASLGMIYEQIHAMEPIEHDSPAHALTHDLYHWPLGAAALTLSILLLPSRTGGDQ